MLTLKYWTTVHYFSTDNKLQYIVLLFQIAKYLDLHFYQG